MDVTNTTTDELKTTRERISKELKKRIAEPKKPLFCVSNESTEQCFTDINDAKKMASNEAFDYGEIEDDDYFYTTKCFVKFIPVSEYNLIKDSTFYII